MAHVPPGRRTSFLQQNPPWLPWLIGALGILLPLCLLLSGLAVYGYIQVGGSILDGVSAGGVPVGELTREQAAITLHRVWNLERRIMVFDGFTSIEVAPADLGLQLDVQATADLAYQVGRGQDHWSNLGAILRAWGPGVQVTPVIGFDAQAARNGLEALATQMSKPPVNATLRLEGTNLVPVPGALGYTINPEETLAQIAASPLAVFSNGALQVQLKPVPPPVSDVTPALAEGRRLMQQTYTLNAYDPIRDETLNWQAAPEDVAGWLRIEAGANGPEWRFDPAGVQLYLEKLNHSLGQERYLDAAAWAQPVAEAFYSGAGLQLRIQHHPTVYTVQSGDTLLRIGWRTGIPYWRIANANPGLDPDRLLVGQDLVIPSRDDLLPLPIIPGKRIVISIDKQRLWVYEGGKLISKQVISTGVDRSPTQPGVFQVQTHVRNAYASVWDLHMPHFLGIYESWPGFMNGLHGLPTLANGQRLWANILGKPASYGCIILDLDSAEWLYRWAEDGVIVEIQP